MTDNLWIEINKRRGSKNRGTSSVSDLDMFRVLSDIRQNFPVNFPTDFPTYASVTYTPSYTPTNYLRNFPSIPSFQETKTENTYIVPWNDDDEKEECCICKEEIGSEENRKKLSCGHKFHGKCLGEWILEKTECPMCRRNLILTQNL